ncbi:IS66 family transposase [Actinocrinis puniceicyclus]|uniref:IS66 family transposase n=1 Tax=Actinocrinis puniceicyclus TaxID=977794 RepID=A0A8J8BE98_9ACTN|nr:IS66 family transposase [Actinocrinis puniceicyclus]MBS2967072.1 IS66 family transposase [Actinocrinis puniceicyclus]
MDLLVPDPQSLSREELIALVADQDAVIARQDAQITAMAGQLAGVLEKFEEQAGELEKLRHLLSRNSSNSSFPSSKDDGLGRKAPGSLRESSGKAKGKQKGAPGSRREWVSAPDETKPVFPEGACECGADLAGALDLGVVDRYQQHELPEVAVKVTQFEAHAVACGCGRTHTGARPEGAGAGSAGYGPNLQALIVYLLVIQFLPVARCCDLVESLTGTRPSAGFVHGMLAKAAAALRVVDRAIRTLITLAFAVCCDETPVKTGPATPAPGKKEAKGYLLVACTELYTHYLLGDRSLDTFTAFVFADLAADAVIVHDRYTAYDSAKLGTLNHQLCLAHILRDLASAAELYPDQIWPAQAADALRELIHRANQARDQDRDAIDPAVTAQPIKALRHAVLIGLAHTHDLADTRPGARKSRLLLEALHQREADFLRFTTDLRIPPTSNQAERDLRPAKIQEKISGRLTNTQRGKDRYLIRGVLSTAIKHGQRPLAILRDALVGTPWFPPGYTPA